MWRDEWKTWKKNCNKISFIHSSIHFLGLIIHLPHPLTCWTYSGILSFTHLPQAFTDSSSLHYPLTNSLTQALAHGFTLSILTDSLADWFKLALSIICSSVTHFVYHSSIYVVEYLLTISLSLTHSLIRLLPHSVINSFIMTYPTLTH